MDAPTQVHNIWSCNVTTESIMSSKASKTNLRLNKFQIFALNVSVFSIPKPFTPNAMQLDDNVFAYVKYI